MSIKAILTELENLNNDNTRLKAEMKAYNTPRRAQVKKNNLRIDSLNANFQKYLEFHSLPGVKFRGTEYRLKEKKARAPKKPKERDEDAVKVLEEEGVQDPEDLLKRLLDARKGDQIVTYIANASK